MRERWNKTIIAVSAGLLLVGCSLFTAHKPDPSLPFPPAGRGENALSGPDTVVVETVAGDRARITWPISRDQRSHVLYSDSPQMLPQETHKTPLTLGRRAELRRLESGKRYYFQVETESVLGSKRSPLFSFRTR